MIRRRLIVARKGGGVDVVAGGGYTPTVIVTNQTELNTELAKSAAQLEGQVIGVQYNATAYTISRTQLRKNYGTGGLVICGDGGTMPVFSSIAVETATNLTLYGLEIANTSATSGTLITVYSDVSGVLIDSCVVHGKHYDPNGDYSSAWGGNASGIGPAASVSHSTGTLTIRNCTVYDTEQGIWVSHAGTVVIENNEVYNTYEDQIRVRIPAATAIPASVTIQWNTLHGIIGLETDPSEPHPDHIDIFGVTDGTTWDGITVSGNVIFGGDSRGGGQGIYAANGGGSQYFSATIKGNVVCSYFARALSVEDAINCTIIGNTVLPRDVGQAVNTGIYVGDVSNGGGHVIKNNVCRVINATSATETNNHEYTTQSNAVLSGLFDGATFALADLDTRAEVLANLSMKVGGALDQTVNIGAVSSGYVDFDARTLNEVME